MYLSLFAWITEISAYLLPSLLRFSLFYPSLTPSLSSLPVFLWLTDSLSILVFVCLSVTNVSFFSFSFFPILSTSLFLLCICSLTPLSLSLCVTVSRLLRYREREIGEGQRNNKQNHKCEITPMSLLVVETLNFCLLESNLLQSSSDGLCKATRKLEEGNSDLIVSQFMDFTCNYILRVIRRQINHMKAH